MHQTEQPVSVQASAYCAQDSVQGRPCVSPTGQDTDAQFQAIYVPADVSTDSIRLSIEHNHFL